jgi:antitoxin MazE
MFGGEGRAMRVQVHKWGNSLAIRIPKSFADEVQIVDHAEVNLSVANGRLVIEPLTIPCYTLEELVEGITAENRHEEVYSRGSIGNEGW